MPSEPNIIGRLPGTVTQEPATLTIQLFSAADLLETVDHITRLGGRIVGTLEGGTWARLKVETATDITAALATLAAVQWIEPFVQPTICNNVAVRPDLMNVTPVWNTNWLGLTGRGQIVGHADSGLDTGNLGTMHPDFTNRVTGYAWGERSSWSDTDGHGTHTAGSILGNGTALSNGMYKGVAYEAYLIHQSVANDLGELVGLGNLNALFTQARNAGARIHSDSWSAQTGGAYDSTALDTDTFAWNNKDMLFVFGSGNDTADSDFDGVCELGLIGSPAVGKNVLAVGASESDRPAGSGGYSAKVYGAGSLEPYYPVYPIHDDLFSTSFDGVHQGMAAFSNRGPTQDGRLKPDVVAPGTDIISCRSSLAASSYYWSVVDARYAFLGGTSMATPLTAGAVALIRQYFVERHAPAVTNPSAALLKATIINGARSLTPGQYGYDQYREIPAGPRPNNVEGWGQVDLANTLTNLIVYDGIVLTTGASTSFPVVVSATNRLCITAVWTDFPGTVGAAKQLVNDLDVLVITPAGQTNYPNALQQPDRLNNVEGLDLATAEPGVYTIVLKGYNVPHGPQPCALVVRGAAVAPALFTIQSTSYAPIAVRASATVLVNGFVSTNASGIATVTLNYRLDGGGWLSVPMALRRGIDDGGAYTAAIPAQVDGTVVDFSVEAHAHDSASALSARSSYTVGPCAVYVWSGGSETAPYDTWDKGFKTLQAAVDAPLVKNGWRVYVTNGAYAGTRIATNFAMRIIFRQEIIVTKDIEIIAPNGPAVTYLDNDYYNRCLTLVVGVADGFTIQRGWGWDTVGEGGISGGGVYMINGTLRNCIIKYCIAQAVGAYGGGVAIDGRGTLASTVIRHVTVGGDWAGYGGGAFIGAGATIQNCAFFDCAAISGLNNASGGGAYCWEGGALSNVTISMCAANTGGGLAVNTRSSVHNSILYHNVNGNYNHVVNGTPSFRYDYTCTTPLPGGTGVTGGNNISTDPQFVNVNGYDLRLKAESPCRDSGQYLPSMTNQLDAERHARVAGATVDRGGYEYGPLMLSFTATPLRGFSPLPVTFTSYASGLNTNGIVYHWDFDANGTPNLSGPGWANPTFPYPEGDYSVSVLASNAAGEIATWFRDAYIYAYETNVHFVSTRGNHTWPYTSWARAATNPAAAISACEAGHSVLVSNGTYRLTSTVTLNGNYTLRSLQGRDTVFFDGGGSRRAMFVDDGAVVDGITVTNGYSNFGGGVFIGNGTLRNCAFRGNWAVYEGGGICIGAAALVQDCLVSKNTSETLGGGIGIGGPATIERCQIIDNLSPNGGGADSYGGSANGSIVRNCLFTRNYANRGGALYLDSTHTIENNTIVDNRADTSGGGIHNASGGSVLRNNIIYYNGTNMSGSLTHQSSCIWPMQAGAGNISNAPAFVNRAAGDYRLSTASDCVNAGVNQGWMSSTTDLDRRTRIVNGLVDMGAYELSTNIPLLRVSTTLVDYGQIFVNSMKQLTLVVRNAGGSVLTGSAGAVTYPFALMSAPDYVLGVNATNALLFKFEPEDSGEFSTTLALSGGNGTTVTLRGTAIPEPMLLGSAAALVAVLRGRLRAGARPAQC